MGTTKRKKDDCPGGTIGKVIDFISKTDQEKIKLAKAFFYPILRFINIGLKYVSDKQTPYQYAVTQMVRKALRSTGHKHEYFIDFSRVILSKGCLTPPELEALSILDNKCEITLKDNSGEGNAQPDDYSMVLFYDFAKDEFFCFLHGNPRNDSSEPYELPERWHGDKVIIYLSMRSADGKKVSNSEYLGEYIVG